MIDLTDRESRQIIFCARLSSAHNHNLSYTIHPNEMQQILDDLRGIATERNQLEDEVLNLSSLVLGEHRDIQDH